MPERDFRRKFATANETVMTVNATAVALASPTEFNCQAIASTRLAIAKSRRLPLRLVVNKSGFPTSTSNTQVPLQTDPGSDVIASDSANEHGTIGSTKSE